MNVIPIMSLVLYAVFYLLILVLWLRIRAYLKQNENIKDQLIRKNRVARNYNLFINTLHTEEKKELPEPVIVLGNKSSEQELTIFTSLYCEMCKEICETINKILFAYEEEIRINIFFKKHPVEDKNEPLYILQNLYLSDGSEEFMKAFNFWFENKNLKPWKDKKRNTSNESEDKITSLNEWFSMNNIISTPSVFINEYIYPPEFDKEDLYYHIEGIIENNE